MICNHCKRDLPLSYFYNYEKDRRCKNCNILRRKVYHKGVKIQKKGGYQLKQSKGDIDKWIRSDIE